MRVGIIFGGFSREREVSFAGGRTVFDNLNKALFEAVPIFVDSFGNFVLLDWQFVYKGSIRDFYPATGFIPKTASDFQIYAESLGKLSFEQQEELVAQIGSPIETGRLKEYIDFAFLTLNGPYGEDGKIQGLLEWLNIPYSGSGILSSAIGINKVIQKRMMQTNGFDVPNWHSFSDSDWLSGDQNKIYTQCKANIGFPMVVKSARQGSSIGVSILKNEDQESFRKAAYSSLFIRPVTPQEWQQGSENLIRYISDFRENIGMPLKIGKRIFHHPDDLFTFMSGHFKESSETLYLSGLDSETDILVESFIEGREFSCIVVEDEKGQALALPPTEIRKSQDLFDYRSKYMPGLSRKITPIQIEDELIRKICLECERLYKSLGFNVYARIDGFISSSGKIFLNDPNTTSGMLPSSFFFHQAAEIGLNPSQFLSYIIHTSLKDRIRQETRKTGFQELLEALESDMENLRSSTQSKIKVGVILGGYSSERHISVESGRNIYEKLSSSVKYEPVPLFLSGDASNHRLFKIPINILLKDNADDIREKINHYQVHPVVEEIIHKAAGIMALFSGSHSLQKPEEWSYDELASNVDIVFIALHGRPGEDGEVQKELGKRNIPYNGSGVESSKLTIDKYATNELLSRHGIKVAKHSLITRAEWNLSSDSCLAKIENEYDYPFIAKPSDDGCSSAVKKIKNAAEFRAFASLMFRANEELDAAPAGLLQLHINEEFPIKDVILIEELIAAHGASRFMEITGGLLTHYEDDGSIRYEMFEPSEALAGGEVLSVEEKFLAGEGQNITPPRFSENSADQKVISGEVRAVLEKTARILNIKGYCRIDAFVRIFSPSHVEVIIIEANSLPGMTPATAIFHQAALAGYKPYEFIDQILEFGQKHISKLLHA